MNIFVVNGDRVTCIFQAMILFMLLIIGRDGQIIVELTRASLSAILFREEIILISCPSFIKELFTLSSGWVVVPSGKVSISGSDGHWLLAYGRTFDFRKGVWESKLDGVPFPGQHTVVAWLAPKWHQ